MILGIDEAGRGPLLGPMVMAGVTIDEKDNEILKKLGVKDSKLITPKHREELFVEIIKIVTDYVILEISPKEIDDAVLSKTTNLNWLEADNTIKIIKQLNPDVAIIDCPSTSTEKYKAYLQAQVGSVKLIVEHKADVNHLVVGAASILAKVTRDRAIREIEKKYGHLGSGYPSDPRTKDFLLKNHSKYPEIFRKSWSSYQNVISAKKQKNLGEF